jgi:hypothetical protein
MASHSKSAPRDDDPITLRPLTPEERQRLLNNPLYRRITEIQQRTLERYGEMEESWPLIREDRER